MTSNHHHHRCPECRHMWDHDTQALIEAQDDAAYERAHICPACGEGEDRTKRDADGAPRYSSILPILEAMARELGVSL